MKTVKTGMTFGFTAVNAGQRNTTSEPQIVVVSTEGGFRMTPAVSKVLGIGHGDNIMFLSNIDQIDMAIANKVDAIVEFCAEAGLELGSYEASVAIHKEFDAWAVAKGVPELDPKGHAKTTTERLTKADKAKYVLNGFEDNLAAALSSDNAEVVEALSREGITKEEQVDILTAFVKPRELPKFKGSKAANPAGLTGAGTSLTFTDSNVWKQLKADMGESATSFNRVFDVDIDDVQDIVLSNGYEEITVKALTLGDYTDKEPSRATDKAGDSEDAGESAE